MEETRDHFVDRVQALSDIELAILLCLITDQHCIIEAAEEFLDKLNQEIKLIARNIFGLTCAVLECSENTTLDDFGVGILADEEEAHDYFNLGDLNSGGNLLVQPDSSDELKRHITTSSRPSVPLDSRKIANIVVARNLNTASTQVQVQVLELIRGKRNFTRTAKHAAPKPFLLVALHASKTARLTLHLNDQFCMMHKHQLDDGLPNLENLKANEIVYADDASTSSVIRSPPEGLDSRRAALKFSYDDLHELSILTAKAGISSEVRAYLHNIVVFMRLHRAVGGGISALATRHFGILARALAPLHGLSYTTPSLVALAARKVYPHRIVITSPENERSMQWGSSLEAVKAVLEGVTADDVVEEVLQSVEAPL